MAWMADYQQAAPLRYDTHHEIFYIQCVRWINPGSEAAGMRFQHQWMPSVNVNGVAAFPLAPQQLISKTIVDAACF
jgi:hypothetical protein